MGCSCLCSPVSTETKAMLAHSYLLKCCHAFESLYGKGKVTPNMHLHTHLVDCVLEYGPVYAFWLFSFERYNGILGEFKTNQLSVEIQIMRKLILAISLFKICLYHLCSKVFLILFWIDLHQIKQGHF